MAKEESIPISKETIGRICEEFGFVCDTDAEGDVSVVAGEEKIGIEFKEDGTLSRGRNKFLSAARKTSTEFAASYPPTKVYPAAPGGKKKSSKNSLPKLNRAFLMKYSGEALEGLEKVLPEVLDAKAEEKDREERISVLEERNGKLQAVLKAVKAADIPAPTGVEDEVSRNDRDLTNLRSQQG